jgi:hypothetical protein
MDLFLSSGEGEKTPTPLDPLEFRLALSKEHNRVGAFSPSPEGGNRSNF